MITSNVVSFTNKEKPTLTIHCNFQTCFSCQKAAGGVETRQTRPHTVHGDSSITTVSCIRSFFQLHLKHIYGLSEMWEMAVSQSWL